MSASATAMSEQTVTGVCTEIAQRPGSEWVEFHIDAGGKYPVRLSTKLQPLIELGRAAGQQLATWTYNESESEKINEKSGKPYVNRYLERVEVGGAAEAVAEIAATRMSAGIKVDATASPTSAPHHQPLIAGDKDRAITRMAVLRTAASQITPGDDVEGIALQTIKLAQKYETWVYRDIDEVPFD